MDKAFRVDIERSRIYWDYYRSMFLVFSAAFSAGMICTALIYTRGEITLPITAGAILLMFLCIILMAAMMSLIIWRHENRHFDELVREDRSEPDDKPAGHPLV